MEVKKYVIRDLTTTKVECYITPNNFRNITQPLLIRNFINVIFSYNYDLENNIATSPFHIIWF